MIRLARKVLAAMLVVILLIVGYLGVTALQVRSSSRSDDWSASAGPAQAIVVLGAAQYNGRPSPVLAKRLDHALDMYSQGAAKQIVVTGYKKGSDRYTEAYASFTYLRKAGVPESALVVVDDGTNTWESLSAVKRVLSRSSTDDVILVSSRYHNRRLQGIAGELSLRARVSSIGPSITRTQMTSETMKVAVGQIVGYRRLAGFTSSR